MVAEKYPSESNNMRATKGGMSMNFVWSDDVSENTRKMLNCTRLRHIAYLRTPIVLLRHFFRSQFLLLPHVPFRKRKRERETKYSAARHLPKFETLYMITSIGIAASQLD